MNLQTRTDCGRVAANGNETHFVTLRFTAPLVRSESERTPLALGIALDRSGSMAGDKLELARRGVDTSLRMLRERDAFALVVFDHAVDTLADADRAVAGAVAEARGRLAGVFARGNTNLAGGWLAAAEAAAAHVAGAGHGARARVLLLTDGQANAGLTDEAELWGRAARLRERGVVTSTLGIGHDFNERLLKGLADQGGGNAYWVENAVQLPDVLAGETGEALAVALRGVRVQVTFAPGARVSLLEQFPAHATPAGLAVDLGEVTSGQVVQLGFEVELPAAEAGASATLGFTLHAEGSAAPLAESAVTWRYDAPEAVAAEPVDESVVESVLPALQARARHEALDHNRASDFGRAREVIEGLARKLRGVAGRSRAMQDAVAELSAETDRHGRAMDPREIKQRYFAAQHAARARAASGRARKEDDAS